MIELKVFALMYCAVALKALQQLNVIFKAYWLVIPTSLGLFSFEVYALSNVIFNLQAPVIFAGGLGAGLGCMTSMYLHKKYVPVGRGYKDK